jgi:hypothetical protein
MNLDSVSRAARRFLPARLFALLRRLGTATITPVVFSLRSGHFRSSLASRAMTAGGEPLPWYTYPAIHFLEHRDWSCLRVLEFGAGQSTLWWASRAREIQSFEDDRNWFRELTPKLPQNAQLSLVRNDAGDCYPAGVFDVAVIDGLDRYLATRLALQYLAPEGIVVVDNSEGSWDGAEEFPIIQLLHQEGFQRVDFYGFAPGVMKPHCTSLFFRGKPSVLNDPSPPVKRD